jgi:precorrin-6B methylase 2
MIIKTHRKALARSVFKEYGGVIQRGPFAGVKFDGQANISEAAHGLKIFGLYEEPVMERLLGHAGVDTFIDVGAGDGYYPVSLLAKGGFRQAFAFEATEVGRAAIARNARLNGVADRLRIFGRAGDDFVAQLAALKLDWRTTVILIDIEGAEFGLLSEALLTLTRGARYVVELHDTYQADTSARTNLLARLAPHWKTEIILDRARDWHGIEQLQKWHDLDRALLVSEGRKLIGEWLVAEPK